MSFVGLLDESLVKVGLESLEKDGLFEEMVDMLVRAGKISDRKPVLAAIHEREDQMTTGIGKGVAVPHVKIGDVEGVMACMGISEDGIEYDAIDGEPVHLAFLVVSAKATPELNIQTLATVARIMGLPGAYARIRDAKSAGEVLAALAELESEE